MANTLLPIIPNRIADFARAAQWIECVGLAVESRLTPDDVWLRVYGVHGMFDGEWVFGDLVKAVRSAVETEGRAWTEYDHLLGLGDRFVVY
jgi:hypothetical protein